MLFLKTTQEKTGLTTLDNTLSGFVYARVNSILNNFRDGIMTASLQYFYVLEDKAYLLKAEPLEFSKAMYDGVADQVEASLGSANRKTFDDNQRAIYQAIQLEITASYLDPNKSSILNTNGMVDWEIVEVNSGDALYSELVKGVIPQYGGYIEESV